MPEVMNGDQWFETVNARRGFSEGTTSWMTPGELANFQAGKEIDWLDLVSQTGISHDYQLSVSGASPGVNYYLSTSFNYSKGIIVGEDYDRISLLGKVDTDITDWLKIGGRCQFCQERLFRERY